MNDPAGRRADSISTPPSTGKVQYGGSLMNRLQNIQALRGVAVLSVLFFHLVVIERKYGGANTLLPDWLQFGMFGVDLFFVISGFVMVTVTRGIFRAPNRAFQFLYHRVSRIYPLYWVYTTLALAVFLVQPTWVNSSQGNLVDIPASYLLLPSDLLPLVQVGWTLVHEMYFYLVFFLILLLLPERFLVPATLAWGAVIVIGSPQAGNAFTRVAFHPLTLEFIAGCLLAFHYHNFDAVKINGKALVAIACLGYVAAILGYVHYSGLTGEPPLKWAQALYYGIPAAAIVFCMAQAERTGAVLPNFLVAAGNASYSIYLSHLFTMNVVGRLWRFFATDSILDNAVVLTAAFALSLIVGFVSFRFIETPLLKLTRRLV